jgi:Asp-tRNA(Asn)/Glu-tRNA(Gln) amidotransferase A subunit family amidase
MDKLGPICRSVEDCALVFDAVHGADGLDPTAVNRPFAWPAPRDVKSLRVGFFEANTTDESQQLVLAALRELGVTLVPIRLPDSLPASALTIILDAEATAVFDGLVRGGKLEGTGRWPNSFRRGELIPAVEYLRANRIRSQLMRQMEELMRTIDVYVGGDDLTITNFTGHPSVIFPIGVETREDVTTPRTITFTGQLYGESELLALAHACESAIKFDKRPDMAALRKLAEQADRPDQVPDAAKN